MSRKAKGILDVKGREVYAVAPDTTVLEAIKLMSHKSIGAVLVMEQDRLVGIMTERDYMKKVILKDRASKDTPVSAIMTQRVLCVEPDRTVEECMALMTERKLRHLPVIDGDKVVGVVSIGDVVKAVIAERGILIEQLERYIMGYA